MELRDKTIKCKDCGEEFIFTVREQEFYAEKGLRNEPQRCKSCRDKKKASRGNDGHSSNRGFSSRDGRPSGGFSNRGGKPSGGFSDRGGKPSGGFSNRGGKPSGGFSNRSGKPSGSFSGRSGKSAAPNRSRKTGGNKNFRREG